MGGPFSTHTLDTGEVFFNDVKQLAGVDHEQMGTQTPALWESVLEWKDARESTVHNNTL